MKLNNFWTRIISGIVLICLTLYLFFQGPLGLALFATLISIFALKEFFILKDIQEKSLKNIILFQSALSLACMPLYPIGMAHALKIQSLVSPIAVFAFIWPLSIFIYYLVLKFKNPNKATLFINAHAYITVPLIMLQQLAQPAITAIYEPYIPMMLMVLVWSSDSWAYVSGKLFGKHKLAPHISPGKTWEGLIGGSLLTALTGFLISYYVFTDWTASDLPTEKLGRYTQNLSPWGWIYTALLGLLVGIFGTLGDLYESSLKRNAGVKDSGNIIPGHGGVLDRYDAFLFAIVVMYVLDRIHRPIIDFLINQFGFF
jgi:phosphatidate cytidylyltransferase